MPNDVLIRREDMLEALRLFTRLSTKVRKEDALIYMEDSDLVISMIGVATGMPVEGAWSDEVRVPANFIVGIAKTLQSVDPVQVRVANGRLYVGSLSIPCSVQQAIGSEIALAIDADLPAILNLGAEYSAEQIELAGLTKSITEAESKFHILIERAANLLSPIKIPEAELARLVREWLQNKGRVS